MAANPGRRLIVVAPTSHLKLQWADAAARLGLHLEPRWSATGGRLPADVHGIVTTYQQVASNPEALRRWRGRRRARRGPPRGRRAGVGRRRAPGLRGVAPALPLSGTPFRSDTRAIPFVSYVIDEARPDFEYGYADALRDGRVVRPVYFPRVNGFMEWVAPDGTTNAAGFDDALDRPASAQRLRTALSLEGEWLADRAAAGRRAPGRHPQGCSPTPGPGHRRRPGPRQGPRHPPLPLRSQGHRGGVRRSLLSHRQVRRPAPTRGSWPCAWCPRASTSPACGWASTPPRRPPTCSSARPWAGSCAGPGACRARRPTCSSPTTLACARGPTRSRTPGGTACASRPRTPPATPVAPDDGSALDELRHEEDRGEQLSMFAALSAVVTGDAEESSVFHLDDDVLDRLDRDDASDLASVDGALDLALPVLPGARPPGAGPTATMPRPATTPPAPPRAADALTTSASPRASRTGLTRPGQRPAQPAGGPAPHRRGHRRPARPAAKQAEQWLAKAMGRAGSRSPAAQPSAIWWASPARQRGLRGDGPSGRGVRPGPAVQRRWASTGSAARPPGDGPSGPGVRGAAVDAPDRWPRTNHRRLRGWPGLVEGRNERWATTRGEGVAGGAAVVAPDGSDVRVLVGWAGARWPTPLGRRRLGAGAAPHGRRALVRHRWARAS